MGSARFLKKLLVYFSDAYFHLWYLPMLIGLMILTPLIWEIVNSPRGKQWEGYMILLFLVFKIAVYTITIFPLPWMEHIKVLLNTVQPTLVTGLCRLFCVGTLSVRIWSARQSGAGYVYSRASDDPSGDRSLPVEIPEAGSACAGVLRQLYAGGFLLEFRSILFFKNVLGKIRWSERQEKTICYLGSCTFGIYLIMRFSGTFCTDWELTV